MRGYYISELLIDSFYKGSRGYGRIVEAGKRDDVLSADNAYRVRVEPTDWMGNRLVGGTDFWATVFVTGDE